MTASGEPGDGVTGLTVAVTLTVAIAPAAMWDRVSDVPRIGEWSPECVHAEWLDGVVSPPHPGARFEAHNVFDGGFENRVTGVVTEASRPSAFAWVVLDDALDLARPGSIWRYDLRPGDVPGTTLVRHGFIHGAGGTGLRTFVARHPESTDSIVTARAAALREHMTRTIEAIARG